MAYGRSVYLLFLTLSVASAFTVSFTEHPRGRKLFGGYRIVPKVCQPTNPARAKSDEPAICMFNYECTRRNGEVVGACMDGFLFGACCQLPLRQAGVNNLEKVQGSDDSLNVYEIDHVPEIPILLNPDGTPVGTLSTSQTWSPTKSGSSSNSGGGSLTKISTIGPPNSSSSGPSQNTKGSSQNAEKPQINGQANYATLEDNFSSLLGQQQVLDDLQLPGLLTHSDSNNHIQEHQDSGLVSPVSTLLNPNQVLQISDPVDQLPGLFSHGIASNNQNRPETILLNENGSTLNETYNPDEIFKPTTVFVSSTKQKLDKQTTVSDYNVSASSPYKGLSNVITSLTTKKMTTKLPVFTQKYSYSEKLSPSTQSLKSTNTFNESKRPFGDKNTAGSTAGVSDGKVTASKVMSTFETTTPMNPNTNGYQDGLVRVPTITYDAGNKKNDELDREEIAINHIISILNGTTPSSETKYTAQGGNTASSIQTWVTNDEAAKPSLSRLGSTRPSSSITTESFPYTYFKHGQSSNYYYEVATESPGTTSYISSSSGGSTAYISSRLPSYTSGTFQGSSLSTRPTTNPPAPTVIVLGPLGTEYTTITSEKPSSRRPLTTPKPTVKSSVGTKKPAVSTTITHNISTVISGATNNKHVVSTSYFSVNLKDGTTSVKPTTISDSGSITENTVGETSSTYHSPSTRKPATVWTTFSTWTNNKPSFHLKNSTPNYNLTENVKPTDKDTSTTIVTSTTPLYEDETAAPDDSIIFPPVRHPELNISNAVVQQEKPTIFIQGNETDYTENFIVGDIPTPSFIEDDVLKNKVDSFVNKIVDSLQGNFEDLKDVVYTKKNATVPSPTKAPVPNKKPASSPTKKPKPTQVSTKKPVTVKKPTPSRPDNLTPGKPTNQKPKPSSGQTATTKKPAVVQKRPKPTKKVPIVTSTEAVIVDQEVTSEVVEITTKIPDVIPTSDFRKACGLRPQVKKGRIVGGKGAIFGEWPWQVLVREATWLGLFTKNKCGGVLITDKYVITAAHCQPGFLASLVAVFGEHDISGELEPKRSVTRNVRRVIVNRGYDPATFENDLALLELETPIQFDAHIVPICMPDDGADYIGQLATVTGWGRLKYNGGVPSVLQEVHVPIMENSVCQEMFQTAGHSKLILDSFLCAGYANGQKDSCEGDSGGPLTIQRADGRWTLVGTVSHGIKCAAPYLPGVYMRTTYFKPWLHTITGV